MFARSVALSLVAAVPVTLPSPTPAAQVEWIQRADSGPRPRIWTALAYDSARDRTVLFGGDVLADPPEASDTWEWDGELWHRRCPAAVPPARAAHAMAYDAARRRVVLFGGGDRFDTFDDTWTWDGSRWTQHPGPGPARRFGHAMVYDAERERVVLFGGGGDSGSGTLVALSDTWTWDGAQWQRARPVHRPPGRLVHAMAYDASRRRAVVFGGDDGTSGTYRGFKDLWEWDGRDWRPRTPRHTPPVRRWHSMAYDAARARAVLFGGVRDGPGAMFLGDAWEWDGSDWRQRSAQTAPFARIATAMTYDSKRGVTVLFGGWSRVKLAHGDTWEYGPRAPARFWRFGAGCGGSGGRGGSALDVAEDARPWIGDSFVVEVRNLALAQPLVLHLGFSRSRWGRLSLPLPLDRIGMDGCTMLTGADQSFVLLPNANGVARWSAIMPANTRLVGLRFYVQAIAREPGANRLGLAVSNGGACEIGAR